MKEKLGIETIIILIAIIITAIFLILVISGKGKTSIVIENTQDRSVSGFIDNVNDPDKLKFNSKFRIAEGKSQPGVTVKNLISVVTENNSGNGRKIEIIGDTEIDQSATYSVSCEYDDDGYINIITITKNNT